MRNLLSVSSEERQRILEMHSPKKTLVREDEDMEMGADVDMEEPSMGDKIEKIIERPRMERFFDNLVDSLSPEQIDELGMILDNLGVDASSDADEVVDKIESKLEGSMMPTEMTEEGDNKSDMKQKIANALNELGAGNIKAWGGLPAAIAIGSQIGSVGIGLAISLGVSGLLLGIAKALDKSGKL